MAAVLGLNAANQAWSRADRAHAGRGEKRAGVNSVLSQTGGRGGRQEGKREKERKEGRKRKKEKGK